MMRYGVVVLVLLVVFIAVDELHARFRNRRQLERLAKGIEAMRRAAALERIGYRPPTSREAALGDLHELFEAAERELHEEGLTVFGDLAEERPGGGITGITRWFVDPTGTVTGWFGVVRTQETGAKHPTMMLFSESESGQFFITGRGAADRFLARAPAIHRAVYPWDQGLAQVLESHLAS